MIIIDHHKELCALCTLCMVLLWQSLNHQPASPCNLTSRTARLLMLLLTLVCNALALRADMRSNHCTHGGATVHSTLHWLPRYFLRCISLNDILVWTAMYLAAVGNIIYFNTKQHHHHQLSSIHYIGMHKHLESKWNLKGSFTFIFANCLNLG